MIQLDREGELDPMGSSALKVYILGYTTTYICKSLRIARDKQSKACRSKLSTKSGNKANEKKTMNGLNNIVQIVKI